MILYSGDLTDWNMNETSEYNALFTFGTATKNALNLIQGLTKAMHPYIFSEKRISEW